MRRIRLVATLSALALALGGLPLVAQGRVLHSATGAGHFATGGFGMRTFSFSARELLNGTVSGQAQLQIPGLPIVLSVEIDCLRVEDNVAVMSGVYLRTHRFPDLEGPVVFAVMDNGAGAAAPPDVITPVLDQPALDPAPVPTCDQVDIAAFFADWSRTVEKGNVNVR